MKDKYDFSNAQRGKFFREGVRFVAPVRCEPKDASVRPRPMTEAEIAAVWAKIDALGGADFLPDGIPDEPPAESDARVFFDDDLPTDDSKD